MTVAALTREEAAEAAVELLSSEVLFVLAARRAAAELRRPEPPKPPPDFATACFLTLDAAVSGEVDRLHGQVGIDADLAAAHLLPRLTRAGVDESDALAALGRVTGWRPRSAAERETAVARRMIETNGFSPEVVAAALDATRGDQ